MKPDGKTSSRYHIGLSMKLAISCPSPHVYSETFIDMQMKRLPCVLRIHGSPIATETAPGGPISPLGNMRGLIDTIIEVGFRGVKGWEGPQRRELMRRMRSAGIDVLLANYGPRGVALMPVCRALGIPLVVHFHGFDAHKAEVVAVNRHGYRELGRVAGAVIAVSEAMACSLERLEIPKAKIHVLRYGCDPLRFQPRTAPPPTAVFFGVGRFVDKKAPYLTLLAFKIVHQQLSDSRLILAGDGVLLETTRNLAKALGLGSAVVFPGVLSPDDVAERMRQATAFVQHSIVPEVGPQRGDSEGTPVAVLEAMATGLPVIATRHAGIGEVIVDERTGLLVEERDVERMAGAMLRVAEDRAFAQRLGLAARQEALQRYTADGYIGAVERVLSSVV